MFTRKRKAAYEALHPETVRGVAGANATNGRANDKLSFAEDTEDKTGIRAGMAKLAHPLLPTIQQIKLGRARAMSGVILRT